MTDAIIGGLAVVGTMVVGAALTLGTCDFVSNMHQQTALLSRIAAASEQTAANTKAPVAVEVSGFSPAAQQVFNQAVKTKGK